VEKLADAFGVDIAEFLKGRDVGTGKSGQ